MGLGYDNGHHPTNGHPLGYNNGHPTTTQLTDTAVETDMAGYRKTDTVRIPDTVSPEIHWKSGKMSDKFILTRQGGACAGARRAWGRVTFYNMKIFKKTL